MTKEEKEERERNALEREYKALQRKKEKDIKKAISQYDFTIVVDKVKLAEIICEEKHNQGAVRSYYDKTKEEHREIFFAWIELVYESGLFEVTNKKSNLKYYLKVRKFSRGRDTFLYAPEYNEHTLYKHE